MEFQEWPKTPRLYRDVTITEKIDGTNAGIHIERVDNFLEGMGAPEILTHVAVMEDFANYTMYRVGAQSRSRMLTREQDNAGFAKWVAENGPSLVTDLGPGLHMGEWWGQGIQRKYGMDRKVFSLFNTAKWLAAEFETPNLDVIPVLYQGVFSATGVDLALDGLALRGSVAAPGFMRPEGICVYHTALRQVLKYTLDGDGHKG